MDKNGGTFQKPICQIVRQAVDFFLYFFYWKVWFYLGKTIHEDKQIHNSMIRNEINLICWSHMFGDPWRDWRVKGKGSFDPCQVALRFLQRNQITWNTLQGTGCEKNHLTHRAPSAQLALMRGSDGNAPSPPSLLLSSTLSSFGHQVKSARHLILSSVCKSGDSIHLLSDSFPIGHPGGVEFLMFGRKLTFAYKNLILEHWRPKRRFYHFLIFSWILRFWSSKSVWTCCHASVEHTLVWSLAVIMCPILTDHLYPSTSLHKALWHQKMDLRGVAAWLWICHVRVKWNAFSCGYMQHCTTIGPYGSVLQQPRPKRRV